MTASVIAVSTSRDDTSDTTCNVTLPATINSGELLLILFWCDGSETITWDNSTAGTWTNLGTDYGTTISFAAYYKIADGTEDSKTLAVTIGNAQESHAVIFRITGHATSGTYIERAGANITSVASKDPPNLAPAWGSGDTLWITAGGILTGAGSAQFTASPSNYTTNYASVIGTNGGVSVGYSWRANTASSEDPDAFTVSTSGAAYMVTVGVKVEAFSAPRRIRPATIISAQAATLAGTGSTSP